MGYEAFWNALVHDLEQGVSASIMAMKFHLGLVELIGAVASFHQLNHIAFSGGVFQNALLVELINDRYKEEFDLYFHKELPPNDENISFGQLAHFFMQQKRISFFNQKSTEICV